MCYMYIIYYICCMVPYLLHLVASKNTHTPSFRTARNTEASSLQVCKLASKSNTLLFVNILHFFFRFSFSFFFFAVL